jgi:hypothetical protein
MTVINHRDLTIGKDVVVSIMDNYVEISPDGEYIEDTFELCYDGKVIKLIEDDIALIQIRYNLSPPITVQTLLL